MAIFTTIFWTPSERSNQPINYLINYLIKFNSASITQSFLGSCNKLNCSDSLNAFQESKVDFYRMSVPLDLLTSLDGVIRIGPTASQLTHAMGSVTPSHNTTKSDIDLIDTVKADNYSIGVFFLFPLIVYLFNYFNRKMVKKFKPRAKIERGSVVIIKLIRIILNQPNYTPNDSTTRLMIALSLFSTLFFLTVYRNIFGSDLTVTESAHAIDYLSQLRDSDR